MSVHLMVGSIYAKANGYIRGTSATRWATSFAWFTRYTKHQSKTILSKLVFHGALWFSVIKGCIGELEQDPCRKRVSYCHQLGNSFLLSIATWRMAPNSVDCIEILLRKNCLLKSSSAEKRALPRTVALVTITRSQPSCHITLAISTRTSMKGSLGWAIDLKVVKKRLKEFVSRRE